MYKEKIQITSNDVDSNYELRLSDLFKIMQLVASNHVDSLHFGHRDIVKNNMLWVVIRINVRIYRTPKMDEVITVTTHPGETKAFMFPRYFQVYDSKGNLIINVSSIWALIDKTTRHVVLKPQDSVKIKGEHLKDDLPLPEKVPGSPTSLVATRKVKYSEIDLNGHLNNTRYIEYILDTHDVEFYKTHRIKSIVVNYDKEIRYNEEVNLYSDGDLVETIKGEVDSHSNFLAQVEYELR